MYNAVGYFCFLYFDLQLTFGVDLTCQVFGMDKRYWFIPAYSDEDLRRMPALQGLDYPSKPDFDSQQF